MVAADAASKESALTQIERVSVERARLSYKDQFAAVWMAPAH
jgi:hypothetical protein